MRAITSLALAVLLTARLESIARTVSREEVERAAVEWMRSSPAFRFALDSAALPAPVIQSVEPLTILSPSRPAWHVALAPAGYLVVAADTRQVPVIAFSVTSGLSLEDTPENALLRILKKDIGANSSLLDKLDQSLPADTPDDLRDRLEENTACWESLLRGDPPRLTDALVTNVAPLLATAWNQTRYFNDLMPACSGINAAYNGHAPAGCGAIAAAQIFNFYRWPPRGTGTQSYNDNGTTRSASLYTRYDWPALLNSYAYSSTYPASNTAAISTLIRNVGYAMEMGYDCSASSSYNQSYADAANRFFFYTQRTAESFNEARARLDVQARRPLQISYDEGGGHMLVADGFALDGATAYYHINYGWGGYQDGWYRPSSLVGSASLDYMTTGVEPLFMPMFTNAQTTVTSTSFTLKWELPAWHTSRVQHLVLSEASLSATGSFSDTANSFTNWWNNDSGWFLSGGAFFYCATNPHQGYMQTLLPVVPSASSLLSYSYRRSLATANHVYVELSPDLGKTWTALAYYTGQTYDSTFQSASFSLSAYSGLPVYLRIRFRHSRGIWGWYGMSAATAGFYLDNLLISNCRQMNLTAVAGSLAPATREFLVTNKYAGTYYHTLAIRDTNNVLRHAPFISATTVSLPPFSFWAVALTNNIVLRWTDPVLCGFPNSTTLVRRSTADYPTNTGDGVQRYLGPDTSFTDTGLDSGITYYYSIWAHDGSGWIEPP